MNPTTKGNVMKIESIFKLSVAAVAVTLTILYVLPALESVKNITILFK